jgi:curved DNA-binding protein CbpA
MVQPPMRNANRLYTVLNVLPDADPLVIEAAYKALMKRHHPDIHPGGAAVAERKAAELNQAYRTLRDPDRRAAYDAEERAWQERHRAELARAFEPPSSRTPAQPPPRPEPPRAGQRVAAFVGAAGILMLGGAIYLLAQGVGPIERRPAREPVELAAVSADQAERAFRDQPVNRDEVERAVSEFRRVSESSGLSGAVTYSQSCFDRQNRTRGISAFDHCVAFDNVAARADASDGDGAQGRFQPQGLVTRHIRAAELIARDPSLIEARLFEIRRLVDNELGRLASAVPVKLSGVAPPPRPLARPAPLPASAEARRQRVQTRPPAERRPAPEQDFLERQGGIY